MKRLFFGALGAFGLGMLGFGAMALLGTLSRSYDLPWLNGDGLTPMWPMTVGFSSIWLMASSLAVLILVSVIGLIRDAIITRRTRTEAERLARAELSP